MHWTTTETDKSVLCRFVLALVLDNNGHRQISTVLSLVLDNNGNRQLRTVLSLVLDNNGTDKSVLCCLMLALVLDN